MQIKILKEKQREQESFNTKYYITIQVVDDNGNPLRYFIYQQQFNDENSDYMNLFKLTNEQFLKDNNVKYVLDENGVIIPIGLIDFQRLDGKYSSEYLHLVVSSRDDLSICNAILDDIVKAIELKYQAVKFIKRFDSGKFTNDICDEVIVLE